MKSGCFELAAAFHQHEPKLAAALAGGAGAPSIRATAAYREPPLRLPRAAAEVPIFVATLLPPHRYVVGAEPALTHAVCDSIREVSAGSTILEPQPDLAAVEAAVRLRMGGRLRESPRGAVARCGERVVVLADEAELGDGDGRNGDRRRHGGARCALRAEPEGDRSRRTFSDS